MNGSWSTWGYTHTSPPTFVAAWRHIVTLFRELGAGNVTWLWTVNIVNDTRHGRIPPPAPWWPGSSYVTWVGIDGYYLKPYWQFAPLFGPTIARVHALTRDPILIAETGATPAADQPAKIADVFAGIRAYGLLGFVWFDSANSSHQDFRINSPAAFTAFRDRCRYLHQAWVMNGLRRTTDRGMRHRQRDRGDAASAAAGSGRSGRGCACRRHTGGLTRALVMPGIETKKDGMHPRQPGPAALPATPGSYLGVYASGAPTSYAGVTAFTRATGVRPRLVVYYSGWWEPFRTSFATTAAEHGAVPLVQIDPTDISLSAIASGRYDAYLTSYAQAVRAYRPRSF